MTTKKQEGSLTRRTFVLSTLGATASGIALGAFGNHVLGASGTSQPVREVAGANGKAAPTQEPVVVNVTPTRLQRGDLLITDQFHSRVLLSRDGVAAPLVEVSTWDNAHLWDAIASKDRQRVYISLSGMRAPTIDYVGIEGTGMVLEIEPAAGQLRRVFTAFDPATRTPYLDKMIDPSGMLLLPDQQTLLISDFFGWQGNGKILALNLNDGSVSVLASGLDAPVGINPDGPDHVLVGNARMPGGGEFGGQVVRVNIHTGDAEVLYAYDENPALISAARLADGTLIAVRTEWPRQQHSVLFSIDALGFATPLYHPQPGFLGSGISVDSDGVWIAESVRRQIVKVAPDGSILNIVTLDPSALDNVQPIRRAFDTIESVRVVE
jgi:hypothetical protein